MRSDSSRHVERGVILVVGAGELMCGYCGRNRYQEEYDIYCLRYRMSKKHEAISSFIMSKNEIYSS